ESADDEKEGNAGADEDAPAMSGIRKRWQVAIRRRFLGRGMGRPRTWSRPRTRGRRRWRGGTDKISFDALDRSIERGALRLHAGLRQRGVLDPKLINQGLAGAIVERAPLLGGVGVQRPDCAGNQRVVVGHWFSLRLFLFQFRPAYCGRTSGGPRSADRRRIEYAAFAPQLVDPARNTERGTDADGALVHLAIVPDQPDNPSRPVFCKAHPLAVISLCADQAPDIRLFGF